MAVEYAGQGGTGNAKLPCGIGYGQAQGGEDVFAQGCAWVWRIEHATHRLLLVVVLIIDQDGIVTLEREGEPPVAIDRD